ncbi:UvrD-helicase domain-containing protein [Sporosarcina sp. ACRSL]|uniref:RNA polymerase recycling motor HelD n=1 Tax=Sporosarcina sp. ACRSL TaxID=2918215 RepID=UPI001EF52269|nr:RNA polymerase recycling motor HelD [Sporosarcina sp. ACRSL]MCG7343817.1 UvrD-helicase domain-containing protein [Sporosarcina sp. ACRSL]
MKSTFQQEQERVDSVVEVITERIRKLEDDTTRQRNEVVNIRKHFWDEVKVNVDSFDDYLETIIGLRQEAQALAVSQSTHRHASKRLSTLRRMKQVPYFGRIDFIEEGSSTEEQIYIGISTLTDDSGEDFLIYDWRAPISSVYYDYQPGDASYVTPGGLIRGKLEKKWQYLIRGGVLQSMFDTSVTIGDEILQIVLGKGTDKHMHSIVATIQQDQNRIIRHDQGKLLIVHGAAGSGKTSAALQRIAYLLYKYRESLNADQIILFSPNTLFNSYVSNVLPELGEENMQQVTFQEYLNHRLSKDYQVENPYDQLEYVLTAENTPSYQARVASIRFKASPIFFEAIESYRKALEISGMQFKDLIFRGKPIVSAKQIENRFYNSDTSLRFHNRLEKLKEWLEKKVNGSLQNEWMKPWVEEKIELLSDEEYHRAHRYLAKKHGFKRGAAADYEMDPKELAHLIVQQSSKSLRNQVQAFEFIDMNGIYKQLFVDPLQIKQWIDEDTPAEWPAICQATLNMLEENQLFYEDATPFLLLNELIRGFQANRTIKHVVVDEAQDYSAFQFEFLRRLFPSAKMTVLGDFNQAIFAHASETVDFHTLTNLYGPDETEMINLARSYRSTKPIIEFTRKLVPNGAQIIPFEREGEQPVLKEVADHSELHHCIAAKVAELKSSGYNTIAIICKSAEESRRAFEALSMMDDIKLLRTGSMEYEQGVVVVPAYLAKGIEFDAVVIYDASEQVYGDESLRRIFYTACTRAMHHLQLYSVGEPTSLLQTVPQDCFILT